MLYCRYRGLQSFKSSPWDPKENLPVDYARIFQFENFRHTQKKILLRAESDNNILVRISECQIVYSILALCFVCEFVDLEICKALTFNISIAH